MSAHFGWLSIVCLSVCLVCWIYIYLDNPEHIRKLFLHDKANEKKTSERHHREIENYIHVKGMALKAQIEASQARAKLEPEVRREMGFFTVIGFSHAKYVAGRATRGIADHY